MPPQDTVLIPVYARGVIVAHTIVDADDAAWASQWRWTLRHGYVTRHTTTPGIGPRMIFMHRELLGLNYGNKLEGDHINRNRLDHRRENLRAIQKHENCQNVSRRGGRSSYRGVCWNAKNNKWQVSFKVRGKAVYFGLFSDEHEAGAIATAERKRLMPFAEH